MPAYRVTCFYNQYVMGWSETYITRTVSASNAAALITQLVQNRNEILWNNASWVGVRVAIESDRRRSSVYLPGVSTFDGGGTITVPATGAFDNPTSTEKADQLRAVMQFNVGFDDTRKVLRYLSSIPDALSATEAGTLQKDRAPQWWQKWVAFAGFLVAQGFQIRARTKPPADPEFQGRNLVLQAAAPGLLGVAVDAAPAPNIVLGDRVHLRGWRRKNRGGISLNGQFFVVSVNTTLIPDQVVFFLRGTAGQDPDDWKILGTIQRVRFGLFAMQNINHHRVGIHKRGRPTMAPHGRRLSRLTLDP